MNQHQSLCYRYLCGHPSAWWHLVKFWFFSGVGALARLMLDLVALGKPLLFFLLWTTALVKLFVEHMGQKDLSVNGGSHHDWRDKVPHQPSYLRMVCQLSDSRSRQTTALEPLPLSPHWQWPYQSSTCISGLQVSPGQEYHFTITEQARRARELTKYVHIFSLTLVDMVCILVPGSEDSGEQVQHYFSSRSISQWMLGCLSPWLYSYPLLAMFYRATIAYLRNLHLPSDAFLWSVSVGAPG